MPRMEWLVNAGERKQRSETNPAIEFSTITTGEYQEGLDYEKSLEVTVTFPHCRRGVDGGWQNSSSWVVGPGTF